ncbi:MAG: heavy metal-binding domain-containing protein [Clostridiales bacterium]|nr:heavy metal-binding domain-containing protein [Clostridiales bacterium]
MICSTTSILQNGEIVEYKGIVTGEVVAGVNFIKDWGASIRNVVGGRSAGYEKELTTARENALREMQQRAAQLGANAVVGVDIDYEVLGQTNNMLMVSATGTAVVVRDK